MDVTSQEDNAPDLLNWGQSGFAFDVRDGYRINTMTLTGTLTGVLSPGIPSAGGTIGVVSNEFIMGRFELAGQSISMGQRTLENVHGDEQIQLNAGMPFEGDFTMLLHNRVYNSAESGSSYWYDGDEAEVTTYYQSYASVHWHDVVLTVQVSPVPEPATYAMLLGGLGIAGFAARRHKV
ncbi:PEPxxWA-CTERM sorting domain-containing protein [Massilia buxea]|nr:PEPxxWA-CTERM sorting domain-containing protein [Pseudoduganella buxea]